MRYLRLVSYAILIVGFGLAVAATTLDFDVVWTLTGLMLVVAGTVKIVTVAIWHGFAGLGPVRSTEDAG